MQEEIERWEKSNAIENMVIDGEKRYFHSAGRNLFRIDSIAARHYEGANGRQSDSLDRLLAWYIPKAISSLSTPVRMKIRYTLSVKADEVPAGETIRVWMPYPRTDVPVHKEIKLISTTQPDYIIASDSNIHKSIYMEGVAKAGEAAVFLDTNSPTSPLTINTSLLTQTFLKITIRSLQFIKYTSESGEHIKFSDNIKDCQLKAVGVRRIHTKR